MNQGEQPFKTYLEGKKILIIDPTRKLRTLLKKMLVDSGVNMNQMTFSEEFSESKKMIEAGDADIVFSSMVIQTKSAEALVNAHIGIKPNRSDAMYFLIVDQNETLAEKLMRTLKVDALFSPPLNGAAIIDTFSKALGSRVVQSSESMQYFTALESYFSENYSEAEEFLREIPNCTNANAYALLGECLARRKENQESKDAYTKALELDGQNYLALKGLSDLFHEEKLLKEAYEIKRKFVSTYKIDQDTYPDLIRLSLSVGALDDVIEYGDKYFEFDERTPEIQRSVAAGLAAVGKVVIRKDPKRGRDVLKKAALLGIGQISIIESTLSSLVENKHYSLAEEILNEALILEPEHPGLQVVKLQLFALSPETPELVLVKGRELISKGIRSPEIYRVMIQTSVTLGKKGAFLEDLLFEAKRDFPELGAEFQDIKP